MRGIARLVLTVVAVACVAAAADTQEATPPVPADTGVATTPIADETEVAGPPIAVEITRERDALQVGVGLLLPLPASFEAALPTGAQVRVAYPLRVRARRRLLWDRRVWRGHIICTVAFDPVTGRYRCELLLDSVIVASAEVSEAEDARRWLRAPPAVRLALPASKRPPQLLVRIRAVFASSTKWLLFPSVEGSDWVEVAVEPVP